MCLSLVAIIIACDGQSLVIPVDFHTPDATVCEVLQRWSQWANRQGGMYEVFVCICDVFLKWYVDDDRHEYLWICSNRWKRSNNPTLGGVSSTPLPSSKFQWKTVPSLRTPPTRKGVHRETKVVMRKSTCPKNAFDVFYVVKTKFCPLLELVLTKFLQPHLLLPLASASRYKSHSPAKAQMRTLLAMVREGNAGEKGKTTAKLYCTQRSMVSVMEGLIAGLDVKLVLSVSALARAGREQRCCYNTIQNLPQETNALSFPFKKRCPFSVSSSKNEELPSLTLELQPNLWLSPSLCPSKSFISWPVATSTNLDCNSHLFKIQHSLNVCNRISKKSQFPIIFHKVFFQQNI